MRFVALATLLTLLGQAPQEDPQRKWADVKEWYGHVSCRLSDVGRKLDPYGQRGEEWRNIQRVDVAFRLPVKPHVHETVLQPTTWMPDLSKREQTEDLSIDNSKESWTVCRLSQGSCGKGDCQASSRVGSRVWGESRGDRVAMAFLTINPTAGTYDLKAGWYGVPGHSERTDKRPHEAVKSETRALNPLPLDFPALDLKAAKLPKEGLILQGEKELKGVGGKNARAWVRWELSPRPIPPVELRFELVGYDSWRPKGSMSETVPGSEITARAWLEAKGGGPVEDKAVRISFELTNVTREKGICINYPREAKDPPDPDLKFLSERNPKLQVGDATAVRSGSPMSEARAVISSFDWGAFGMLRVRARLESGREVVGKLKSDPEREEARIPKCGDDSWIADSWKKQTGANGADSSDDEDDPPGDGNKGDGLTLYEEYRGYMLDGTWVTATPKKKDFFIVDEIGGRSKSGIRRFRDITNLEVHHRLKPSEVDDARVINFNRTAGPHLVSQHAIRLVLYGMQDDCESLNRAGGPKGPGTPKRFDRLIMTHAADPSWEREGDGQMTPEQLEAAKAARSNYWDSTLAHELLHCCSVWHHGDHDVRETWEVIAAKDGTLQTWRTATRDRPEKTLIRVYGEDGTFMAPHEEGELNVYVGEKFGQHSGNADCVERYDMATVYRRAPNEYYWIAGSEKTGAGLCTDTAGTMLNAKTGQPRYGPACPTNDRGNCAAQICVSDAATPKNRFTDHVHR